MTNEEYYIDVHQGDWRRAGVPIECCGWAIDPLGQHCTRTIQPGEDYLITNIYNEGQIVLCRDCARKPA
jgi:hypothetical protein